MITSLSLKNFRGFKELTLKGLQRVNLIVGRNNAGKTSLLESILILANPQEIGQTGGVFRAPTRNQQNTLYRWLLRDGPDINEGSIGSIVDGQRRDLSFYREPSPVRPNAPGTQTFRLPNFVIEAARNDQKLRTKMIAVQGVTPDKVVKLFGAAVVKRGGEEQMDKLFHEIDNRVRKVRVISANDGFQIRFDFNLTEMIPLSQVGQGMYRLITIFSELIAEPSDVCLIDEVENGIHHSMLEQVWSGLAAAAENLNTQIFATTHSYECIEAAHSVFSKRASYDFSIIQLFRADEGVRGRVLDQKHIDAAILGDIDLR